LAEGTFKVTGTSSEPARDPASPDIVVTSNGNDGLFSCGQIAWAVAMEGFTH
jgi:hypothetical protein